MFGKDKKEEFHEKILYETQPNIFVYSKGILISMFVLGFLFFLYSAGISYIGNMNVYLIESTKVPLTSYFALAVFVLIMIVFLYIILKLLIWTSIKYTITESRVVVEKGILLQKKNYMPFNTIQDVSRSQSLLGKLFSVGTITLYSAYDGKELELKDVSSPKKIEDLIFENMRGTHLRYRNVYDDSSSNFNPIRPNSDEPTHYRRMEDLDDLQLVDAKERKRQLREIRRKAKNSRNNYNPSGYDSYANSSYGSQNYGSYNNSATASSDNSNYDEYYEDDYYGGEYYLDDHKSNRNASFRDNGANSRGNRYNGSGRYPESRHQYSGAIKESYERNPKKYFANNYEEFHQNNLEAQRDYQERMDYSQNERSYPNHSDDYYQNMDLQRDNKKSRGLSRFNPFSSNKSEDDYEQISDDEFDSTINQAMHNMDSNIKFEPSKGPLSHDRSYNSYKSAKRSGSGYVQSRNRNDASYSREPDYDRDYREGSYSPNSNRQRHRPLRGDYDGYGSREDYRHYDFREAHARYDSRDNYNHYDSRDAYGHYDSGEVNRNSHKIYDNQHDGYSGNHSRRAARDDDYSSRPNDYGYGNHSNHSRAGKNRSFRDKSENYQQYDHEKDSDYENTDSSKDKKSGEKTPEDLFAKHSRKFRR